MRLVVITPSADYAANAGARIRYGRLIEGFFERGASFTMEPIAGFDPATAASDVVIFSKCHDARAIVCAHMLSQRGIRVGVDIFDDYFSQAADSRLNRLRSWLSDMLGVCDFALASTPATAELVQRYSPNLPVHILNDPAPLFDAGGLAHRLLDKLAEAASSGRVKVAWFGMGDNPHFALGLRDVAAFAGVLSALAAGPFAVDLTILTNRRALDAAGLERIMSLPVTVKVEIWSEEREATLLDECLVAFLPVNANRFSRAKSLNRAVTALAAGCQLLTAGFPLYAPLDPFLYRSGEEILEHLHDGTLRLSLASLGMMEELFANLASIERETEGLLAFIGTFETAPAQTRATIHLVHGATSNVGAHNLVRSAGGLSVASPFCTAPFDFDAIVVDTPSGSGLGLYVARSALGRLAPGARKSASRPIQIRGRKYWQVSATSRNEQRDGPTREPPLPLQLGLYPSTMDGVRELLMQYFNAAHIVTSEYSSLPFEPPGAAHG